MRVQVTLPNILEYGLDIITGNSRADLLARAAELEAEGYDMFVNIPDVEGGDNEAPKERNVFEHFSPELPEPDGATHLQEAIDLRDQAYSANPCYYQLDVFAGDVYVYLCQVHNRASKYSITPGSHEPCLEVDPYDE